MTEAIPGSSAYRLRQAGATDLELILQHRRQMFIDMGYDPAATDASIAANRGLFGAALEQGRYRGFFAEDGDGRVVAGGGIVSYAFHTGPAMASPERSWIVNVYTEPAHRRRGLARAIMQALVKLSGELGWTAVFLHASTDGRPLYESLGFKANNEMVLKLRQ